MADEERVEPVPGSANVCDTDSEAVADDDPGTEATQEPFRHRSLRWVARLCGIGQLLLGLVAILGLAAFFQETENESLRYQYLMVPILIWMVSVTILFASVLVIARSPIKLTLADQLVFQLGSAVPTIAMAGVLVTPAIG